YLLSILTPMLLYVLIDNDLLDINKKSLIYIVAVYVAVALIQLLFDPDFLSWLVARSTEQIHNLIQTGRGVRSLASEPSSYGKLLTGFNILCIFLLFR